MVDLDELDRLHAALPELEPQTIYVGDAEALAIICEAPWRRCVAMHDAASNAVTILRAYPALSAEVRALRKVSQDRYAEAIADVVAWLRRKHDHGDVLDRVIDGIEDCAHVGAAKEG